MLLLCLMVSNSLMIYYEQFVMIIINHNFIKEQFSIALRFPASLESTVKEVHWTCCCYVKIIWFLYSELFSTYFHEILLLCSLVWCLVTYFILINHDFLFKFYFMHTIINFVEINAHASPSSLPPSIASFIEIVSLWNSCFNFNIHCHLCQ